jgi:hypothetical protein
MSAIGPIPADDGETKERARRGKKTMARERYRRTSSDEDHPRRVLYMSPSVTETRR